MKGPTKPLQRLLTSSVLLFTAAVASATVISLDPRATYLRTDGDAALDAVAYPLSSFDISPGDWIRIERLGFYSPLNPGYPDINRYLDAVFSGSAALLSYVNLNRVQNAIDAGTDFVSPNTWIGSLSTDITQDFAVDDGSTFNFVELQVPAGATHIFFTVSDSLFGDNGDPNGDFGAAISIIPEPSIAALSLTALAFAARRPFANVKQNTL